MKCKDCPHFRILYDPIGKGMEIWDFGKAKCEKHDLYVEFANKRKLNKLECMEGVEMKMTETEKMIRAMTDEELIREMREYSKKRALLLFRDRIMFDEAAKRMESAGKTGEWEPVLNGIDDDTNPAYDCSECGAMVQKEYNYCPRCGAKMKQNKE